MPNTTPLFPVFDPSEIPLIDPPTPFKREAWKVLLKDYPGELPDYIDGILTFGCRIGYSGNLVKVSSKNLTTVKLNREFLTELLTKDLKLKKVQQVSPDQFPLRISPLGLVPKPSGAFRRIHHLSHPRTSGTNAGIESEYAYLCYARISGVIQMILKAGRNCYLIKRDMEAAFRNIPVSVLDWWLLAFKWNGKVYVECCLPFGLRTAPFLFNLFAEAFEWILISWLHWELVTHLLDDVVYVLPEHDAHKIPRREAEYVAVTDFLGIPRQAGKDECGQVVPVFGYELDTVNFIMRLPAEKVEKLIKNVTDMLDKGSATLHDMQVVAGLCSWAAPAVQLGWVFCRNLWNFEKQFNNLRPALCLPLPPIVCEDLQWWREFSYQFNGTYFFDDSARRTFHLFTDASGLGMGGFFYEGDNDNWKDNISIILQANSFACTLPTVENAKNFPELLIEDKTFDINIWEVQAVLEAVERWCHIFSGHEVVIHTDNSATSSGITKGYLAGPANIPLRNILCKAAAYDIKLTAAWFPGKDNELADSLSRFEFMTIANWCPHW